MSKFCSNCGTKLEDNISFCPECGQKIESADTTDQQPINPSYIAPNQPMAANHPPSPQTPTGPGTANPYQQAAFQQQPNSNMAEALKWATYVGRLNRKRFFLRSLALGLLGFFIALVVIFVAIASNVDEFAAQCLAYLFTAPIIVLSYMTNIKRCHDLNKSGWFVLLLLIPIVNIFFNLYLLFVKGTEGPNQYGDDPLLYHD